jgi:hypothetical protein
MTRERLIELYEAELRQALDDLGDDFDFIHQDIDFTDTGATIYGDVELLPPGSIDAEMLAGYL